MLTSEMIDRTLNDYINGLKKQEQVNRDKINDLASRNKQLHRKVQALQQAAQTKFINQSRIQYFSETKLVEIEGKFQSSDDVPTIVRNRIEMNCLPSNLAGQIGLIRPVENLEAENTSEYKGVYSIIEEEMEIDADRTVIFKEGMYATLYTRNSIKPSLYEELLEYVKKRGYHIEGPFLIRQIVDAFITANENELLSEVRIRVRK
ncbi:hypothetical protein [Halobacillus sp. K22]|uniref:hypothetical protein n=1 Tax=Halobacillus sp. K22 TaxID=3457431 RepID=UPI003FCC6C96